MKTKMIVSKDYDNLEDLLRENKLELWRIEECSNCITDVQILRRLEKKSNQKIKYTSNKIIVI